MFESGTAKIWSRQRFGAMLGWTSLFKIDLDDVTINRSVDNFDIVFVDMAMEAIRAFTIGLSLRSW